MTLRPFTAWRGPPLALQIVSLLLGVLVVAQFATLVLTLLLPPAPQVQYELDDVAAKLAGGDPQTAGARALVRTEQAGPPDIGGPGWLVAERSRQELARLVGVAPGQVTLAFYTPLPFAGTAVQRPYAMVDDGPVAPFGPTVRPAGLLAAAGRGGAGWQPVMLQVEGAPPMMGAGGGNMPGPPGLRIPGRDTLPPSFGPGGPGRFGDMGRIGGPAGAGRFRPGEAGPLIDVARGQRGRDLIRGDGGAAIPPLLRGGGAERGATVPAGATPTTSPAVAGEAAAGVPSAERALAGQAFGRGPQAFARDPAPPPVLPKAGDLPSPIAPDVMPRLAVPERALALPRASVTTADRPAPPAAVATPAPRVTAPSAPLLAPPPPLLAAPSLDSAAPPPAAPSPAEEFAPAGPPIRVTPPARSLFGLAAAPFVQGDFIAALRLPSGRWAVVQPAPEPFPNSWQRRVLLWFAVSLALIAPFGWAFARRLVKPLERFAGAAEQLGRDPVAVIGPLDGPAEIGRAAHAFNLMQTRLRTFVEDRTAMIGAISHDLRTPLTRMRFRIEDVPDGIREGLLEEVDDMEAMINEVIAFLRDASTPGTRERCDLHALVEDVVENARMVGSDVTIEHAVQAPVEVDVLGMRRLLDNLLENAVKYGTRARIRLSTDADSAIAEVIDEGPGLPDDEIERVFEPFYRSEAARASDKAGSGLGLAVCRSIARAHGGDVRLHNTSNGFAAEMRVPLVYGAG